MAAANKPYDIVVFGVTGFTGRLVAKYLLSTYGASPARFKWAVAGRSAEKLEQVKALLAEEVSLDAKSLPTLTADSDNLPSLDRVAASARVVLTTVGPYFAYGEKLVDACSRAGTHYVDLTGESIFVEDMIRKYDGVARSSGAKIVHSCGFDSIPADLGAFMMAQHLRKAHGRPAAEIKYFLTDSRGGVSGGTIASVLVMVQQLWEGGRAALAKAADPYLLVPPDARPPFGNSPGGFGYDRDVGGWTAPLPFASHDSKIVHRSNALLQKAYGENFHYKETIGCKGNLVGLIKALFISVATSVFSLLLFFPLTRGLLAKYVLPSPGEGPTKKQMEEGYFWIDYVARAERSPEGGGDLVVWGRSGSDKGDCGYKETSKMIAECALCLALDDVGEGGGILTTASAMGDALLARLRAAGMTFKICSSPPGSARTAQ